MPKFIGTITRDETSDFKLVTGQDVNIRGSNDSTYLALADDDLLLLDDVSLSPGKINGTENSTGKIQMSQIRSYIGLADIAVASSSLQLINENTSINNTSVFYHAVESSVIEDGKTLTVESGVDFNILKTSIDTSTIDASIDTNAADIVTNASDIAANKAIVDETVRISTDVQLENQRILDNIDAIGEAHNRLRDLIAENLGSYSDAANAINDDNYTIYEDSA